EPLQSFHSFICGFVFYSQKGGKPLPHNDSFNFYGSIFVLNTCSPSTYSRIVADLTGLWFSSIVTLPETSEMFSVASNASLIASGSVLPALSIASFNKYTES